MAATPAPTTFPDLLASRLRHAPGAPLVTYYDDATGERTELSVTSYANWVAKHANLWVEELDLEPEESTVLVDLPGHWLVPVLLGGAWAAGVAVTTDLATPYDVVVTEASGAATYADGEATVVACSLHPFALPSSDPLPPGVLDHGHLWPGQSDVHVPVLPVGPDTVAWRAAGVTVSQSELLARAAGLGLPQGGRLLTTAHPAHEQGVPDLLAPLLTGSVVHVRHAAASTWDDRLRQERVDLVHGGPGQPPVL
ncbi:TIGR03089 family protein [Nocardioides aequoreus]|uniref:TIGR03089 family protein n=1 Tax=Nocardioides aequoreus TaxID=397278 RepID=UPI00068FC09A|nr:TIGR03089 family protein [Nocardioides aequoreus]